MALVGMQGQADAQAMLDRIHAATQAVAGGGDGFVAQIGEANAAFTALWQAVPHRLREEQARAAGGGAEAIVNDIRDRLQLRGLGDLVAAVTAGPSVAPLQQRLAALLARNGWEEAGLVGKRRTLEEARDKAAVAAGAFAHFLGAAPKEASDQWRTATREEETRFRALLQKAEGRLKSFEEAACLSAVIAELQPLVEEYERGQKRAAALQVKHEGRLFALWVAFINSVSACNGIFVL
jgi:hypothetical protein